jgi:hypothetical protein
MNVKGVHMKISGIAVILICSFVQGAFSELKAHIVVDKTQLVSFLLDAQAGTDAKLIFCESGKMFFIDFSEDAPVIQELVNAEGGVLPVISPDGRYFVYSKGVPDDGETTLKSRAYISELASDATPVLVAEPAYVPRFVQDSSIPKVLYSTCASHPDVSKFAYDGCGKVLTRQFLDGQIGDADTVWSGGSYFGGLSVDGGYLCTAWLGNGKAYMLNLTIPNPIPALTFLKLRNKQTGNDTMFSIGACNPSISSSRNYSDAMMFVDFGCDQGFPPQFSSAQLPAAWEQHERLWICKLNGDVLRCMGQKYVPQLSDDEYMALSWEDTKGQSYGSRWDFPEWSNHPYLAAAGILVKRTWKGARTDDYDDRKMVEHIYLINLKTSAVLPLVSVTDTSQSSKVSLKWPWFWTSVPQNFSEQQDWLATTGIRPQYERAAQPKENQAYLLGNTIISGKPIRNVAVCDLSGRCLWKAHYRNSVQNVAIPQKYIVNKVTMVHVQLERCFWMKFRSIKIE